MKKLAKFISLPIEEKVLFFQSVYYLINFRIRLVTTAPKSLFSNVSKKSNVIVPRKSCCIPANRIARIINEASRFVPYSTCLSKALAGYVLFAKNRCMADLHIGVSKNEMRQLEAHAWLSYDGKIFIGNLPDLERFQELPLKPMGDHL